ncbi:GNAT family N-acetyltransferase [Agromyces sp. G08B096]|uniref:GNAT family N-acetyltransferase n=1 Tax=Agromyces sp. G08B096 TaxID=3156399 RepID=A0AAU7WCJ1_9MICO
MRHPLDRPAWSALSGRQHRFAVGDGAALRFDPEVGPFAAVGTDDDDSLALLAGLVRRTGRSVLLQRGPVPPVPGVAERLRAPGVQLVLDRLADVPDLAPEHEPVELGLSDAAEMVALARLTEPGPFEARTPELGGFLGIRDPASGELVAMAGQRMQPAGHTEVSGVCTHPDHRGKGFAAALSAAVARRILARGDTPFLHAYAGNRPAIALYERLGFVHRADVEVVALEPAG